MKKIFVFLISLNFFVLNACSETEDICDTLTGNWYRNKNPDEYIIKEYSWGDGKTVPNFTLELDFFENNNTIRLPMIGGPFRITELIPLSEDDYKMTFFFDRGNFNVTYTIHVVSKDVIWFELITDKDLSLIPTGQDFLWYKISGKK